jgi:hypothetical protein
LRKAQQEVATFHRFQELCGQIIEVREKICTLRPVEETLTPEEQKTAEMIHTEIAREVTMLSAVSLPTAIEVDASIWKPWRRRFALPCTKRE